jgi:hypothetical protein
MDLCQKKGRNKHFGILKAYQKTGEWVDLG